MRKLAMKWSPLEKDLGEWLSSRKGKRLEFRNSFQAIPGFPSSGFRSDALLTDGRSLLAVEVEVAQTHPDANVGKYWLLHDRHQKYDRIVLYHIYTPAFDSYGWRKELGEFYIDKMQSEVPIEYHLIEIPQSEEYSEALSRVKELISVSATHLFASEWKGLGNDN